MLIFPTEVVEIPSGGEEWTVSLSSPDIQEIVEIMPPVRNKRHYIRSIKITNQAHRPSEVVVGVGKTGIMSGIRYDVFVNENGGEFKLEFGKNKGLKLNTFEGFVTHSLQVAPSSIITKGTTL